MTQNKKNKGVYAIWCRVEVDDDVIFSRNIKTIQDYVVVNFEDASFSTVRDFPKNHL